MIRIVGDGTIAGTKLYDESGNELTDLLNQCSAITIVHRAGDIPRATLEIPVVAFDIRADGQTKSKIVQFGIGAE
jgi:hypothetical protein